jgi:hypothetical protein
MFVFTLSTHEQCLSPFDELRRYSTHLNLFVNLFLYTEQGILKPAGIEPLP